MWASPVSEWEEEQDLFYTSRRQAVSGLALNSSNVRSALSRTFERLSNDLKTPYLPDEQPTPKEPADMSR